MNPPNNSGEPPKEGIAATDEILQVMYWLRGESIAQEVAPNELAKVSIAGWVWRREH